MIVCVCKGVRLSEIEAVTKQGVETVEELKHLCGAGMDCGSCVRMLKAVFSQGRRNYDPSIFSPKRAIRIGTPALMNKPKSQ